MRSGPRPRPSPRPVQPYPAAFCRFFPAASEKSGSAAACGANPAAMRLVSVVVRWSACFLIPPSQDIPRRAFQDRRVVMTGARRAMTKHGGAAAPLRLCPPELFFGPVRSHNGQRDVFSTNSKLFCIINHFRTCITSIYTHQHMPWGALLSPRRR